MLLCLCLLSCSVAVGWMHILIGLLIASFFSRAAMILNIAIWLTVLLPPKPVLWNAFCRYDMIVSTGQHSTGQHV
jgi:hypothetical protein